MNAVDQQEYKDILKAKSFVIEPSAMKAPSNHKITRAFKAKPLSVATIIVNLHAKNYTEFAWSK